MFERFNEPARKVIFFARYEAFQFGSPTIELEHLVLGVLRESGGVPAAIKKAVRKRIEECHPAGEKRSVSVDLPLSPEMKRAVAYADKLTADTPRKLVTPRELLAGVLESKDSLAALLVRDFEILYYVMEGAQAKTAETPEFAETEAERPSDGSSTLTPLVERLEKLVEASDSYLQEIGEVGGDHVLKRKEWTKREALGHLVDWASTYHQWCARVLTEPLLNAHSYPLEDWVNAQHYREVRWRRLVSIWVSLNRLLVHVAARIPEKKLTVPCRVGIDPVQPFRVLFERYLEHHEDLLGQILARD